MRSRAVIVSPSAGLSSSLKQVLRDSGCSPEVLDQHPAINNLPALDSAEEPPAAILIDSVSENETLSLFWRLRDSLLRFGSSGTPLNNVCLFVNRDASWGDVDKSTLEQIVGLPVEWIIDNDYSPERQVTVEGEIITDLPVPERLSATLGARAPVGYSRRRFGARRGSKRRRGFGHRSDIGPATCNGETTSGRRARLVGSTSDVPIQRRRTIRRRRTNCGRGSTLRGRPRDVA